MIDLAGVTPIENAFYDMGKMDFKTQEYFFTYFSQKLVLLNHFYPHVEGMQPGFTEHGPEHIVRVMRILGKMLKNNIAGLSDSQGIVSTAAMNYYEIYLLLCATVWHDVGNLLGRDKHNQKIVEISDKLKNNFFVDEDTKKYALQIAKAHSGVDGVRQEISMEDVNYKNEEINLRFLGVLLRFADELDEGDVRVDKNYYGVMKDKIPDENKIYWETGCCVNLIKPEPGIGITIGANIKQENLFRMFTKNGKNVALIDELIFRIDKMNRERIYYMQFVRKHVEFRQITFDLTVENSKPKKFIFRFNNDRGYEDFWNNYSDINPERKMGGYILQSRC